MLLLGFQAIDSNSLGKIEPVLEEYGSLYDAQFERDAPQAVLGRSFVEDLKRALTTGERKVWTEEGNGPHRSVLIAHQLDWDSDFFGFRIDRLDYLMGADAETLEAVVRQYLKAAARSGVRQISSRVNVRETEAANALLRNGFTLVGTKAMLRNPLRISAEVPGPFGRIRPFRAADMDSVRELASSAAEVGRFANDYRFDKCRVRRMYEHWALEQCANHGDQVLVAEVDGKVAGFLAFTVGLPLYGAPDVANLRPGVVTLVVVDRLYRGQGLGHALLAHGAAQMRRSGARVAYATTAFGNAGSLAAFQSAGFRVLTGHWEFHWWLE